MKCIGFPFVARANAQLLILGSLPGEESLRRQQYYAKAGNSFWKIMGMLVGASPEMIYEKRLRQLTNNGIALWDVCASAERIGSLDSKIQVSTIKENDFVSFFKTHKYIKLIAFNGQPAEKLFRQKVLPHLPPPLTLIPRVILPSTSPAHAAMRVQEKLFKWRAALAPFIKN